MTTEAIESLKSYASLTKDFLRAPDIASDSIHQQVKPFAASPTGRQATSQST